MRTIVLFYIIVITNALSIHAQENVFKAVEAGYYEGFNINQSSDRNFGRTRPGGLELSWLSKKEGKKEWEILYGLPKLGWRINWFDHRNKLLGHSFAIARTIEFDLLKFKRSEINLRASQGLMYTTKHFNNTNGSAERYNNALGQSFNFSEEIGLGFTSRISTKLAVNFFVIVTHYSSGAIAQPNDGLNLLSFQGTIQYKYSSKDVERTSPIKAEATDKRLRINFSAGSGINQINTANTKKYPLATFMLFADKHISKVNKLSVGCDLFVNTAIKHEIENDSLYKGTDHKKLGVSAGYELLIDKLGVVLQCGYQFYSPYPALKDLYQKFGLKYYVSKNLFAVVMLRGYKFGISDELSWGMGVRF